jgi:hypothetical protein
VGRVTETGSQEACGGPAAAYYLPGPDGAFTPTIATESPWDSQAQHGGPPCALLAHVIRSAHPAPGFRIARITAEFLGPVPRRDVAVSAAVIRDGRRIRLIEATMTCAGRPVALARAWQIAAGGGDVLAGARLLGARDPEVPPLPPEQPRQFSAGRERWGYGESVEWRRVRGAYRGTGYAQAWLRPRIPLIAGTDMHPLDRALVVADSANGVSARLGMGDWLFVPTAVTVTLHRYPEGEWVLISARTDLAGDGIGSTAGTLSDASGPFGSVTQPLLVAPVSRR